MLEYLSRDKVADALTNLKQLLKKEGVLLVLMTRRNFIRSWLAEKWWKTHTYDEREIRGLLHAAGFTQIQFREFSPHWANSMMVIEAKS